MKWLKTGVFISLFVLVLVGCSTTARIKSLFVSGVSLDVVGTQFVQVSEQVTAGCEAKVIPVITCAKYRAFGEHFKQVYPLTVGMWEAARNANDSAVQGRAEDVVRSLAADLSKLAVEALGAFAPEVK